MIEDSTEEFLMALSGYRGFDLPSPKRHGTVATPAPVTTTPQMENTPITSATMMIPPRMAVPRPEVGVPLE
jgi:hypothetical protein